MKRMTWLGFFLFQIGLFQAQSLDTIPLPSRFDGLERTLRVNHFPNPVDATTDKDSKYNYLWKHTTSVLSPSEAVTIEACGAYIFYGGQWNLRINYGVKGFAKLFDCPKGKMKKGQPYTFKDNWRTANDLTGGWAMWYFIGTNEAGRKVYGVGKVYTSDQEN
ncbi:MAG: hypothetical protein AAF847_11780 [Bacteroidota bacterium]